MSAFILQIADAVVTTINGASLTPTFTAARAYVPIYDLQRDLSALKVSVVPRELSLVFLTRNSDDFTYDIDVSVQQKIGNDVLTEAEKATFCDPLMLLMEKIIDLFRGKPLAGVTGAQCMAAANPAVYIPDLLDEKRTFTSVATLSFKVARARP